MHSEAARRITSGIPPGDISTSVSVAHCVYSVRPIPIGSVVSEDIASVIDIDPVLPVRIGAIAGDWCCGKAGYASLDYNAVNVIPFRSIERDPYQGNCIPTATAGRDSDAISEIRTRTVARDIDI